MTDSPYKSAARGSPRGMGAHEIDWAKPDDDEIVDFVSIQYRAGKDRRRPWEAVSMENLAFMGGDQHVKFSSATLDLAREIVDAEVPEEWNQQIEVNTLKGFVLQRMAFLVGVPITWFVRPFSADDDDVYSSKLGQKLLQYQWAGGDPGFQTRFLEALWIMFGTGVIFAHPVWDPTRGERTVHRPPKGTSEESGKGREGLRRWVDRIAGRLRKKPSDIRLGSDGAYAGSAGEVHVEFATGFEITEPAHCQNIEDAAWLIYSKLRTIESLRERYGSVVDDLNPDNDSDVFQSGWRAEYGDFSEYSNEGSPEDAPADHAFVHELWRPASSRYPEGYRAVISQDTVLDKGYNPYVHGRLPFAGMKELPERRFRPRCSIGMLIKMQAARNSINGKVGRHVNKVVDPHMLAEKGTNLPEDFLQRGPSKTTEIPEGQIDKIKPLQMPGLPPVVLQFDERLRANMMEVMGIHDSSLGRAESAQQSGRHAAILQQSDARGNSVTRMLVEEALCEIGSQSLWLYYQYVRKQRLVVLCGTTYAHEAVTFKGTDLYRRKGGEQGPTTFNVEVSIGSEPDMDAVAQRIEMLIKAGVLDPANREADRLRIEKMLGEASARDTDQTAVHRSNAARENAMLLQGNTPKVARGDADPIHIDEHERWTTTEEYRRAAEKNRNLPQQVELHLREHLYQLVEKRERPKLIAEVIRADLRMEYGDRLGPNGARVEGVEGQRVQGTEGPLPSAPSPINPSDPSSLMKFAQ